MQGVTDFKCLANKCISCFSVGLTSKNKILYRTKEESLGQDNAVDIKLFFNISKSSMVF